MQNQIDLDYVIAAIAILMNILYAPILPMMVFLIGVFAAGSAKLLRTMLEVVINITLTLLIMMVGGAMVLILHAAIWH